MQDSLVTAAEFIQSVQAHAAKNYLAENGISSFILNEHNAYQGFSNLLQVKLQVAPADLERARELLAQRERHTGAMRTESTSKIAAAARAAVVFVLATFFIGALSLGLGDLSLRPFLLLLLLTVAAASAFFAYARARRWPISPARNQVSK
jgi:hypothetical protein